MSTSRSLIGSRHNPNGKPCPHEARFGLTCDEFDALRSRANGHCELCGVAEDDTPRGELVIDHFHGGRHSFVRGLLCDRCNGGIMNCLDGKKVWGANRKWEQRAREFEARSWHKPSPQALALMAARTEKLPKNPSRRLPDLSRLHSIGVPTRRGLPAMADRLRYYLSPEQREELARLLVLPDDESTER